MLDIPSVSAIIASLGVLIGVVFTVLEVRSIAKTRRTDMLWRLYSSFNSKEYLEAWLKVWNLEFEDYNDYVNKYGLPFSETSVNVALCMVCNLFEGAGTLLEKRLIDLDIVSLLPIGLTWKKIKPLAEGARKQYNQPGLWVGFEYLVNELQKREQQIAKIQ